MAPLESIWDYSIKMKLCWGGWVAQSVEQATLDSSSGRDLRFRFVGSCHAGLHTQQGVYWRFSSPLLLLLLACLMLTLSSPSNK